MSTPTVTPSEAYSQAEAKRRAQMIADLRAYADWLEEHPDAHHPCDIYSCQRVEAGDLASMARTLGGHWEKGGDDTYFELLRNFGPNIRHGLFTDRAAVCERVVVATEQRIVNEPDPDAVAALPKVRRVETVEKVEWRCPESLHALSEGVTVDGR